MFKLVVLCAFFAAAAAEPGALIAAPITQYTTYLAPGSTTIAKQDSTVIHPSPLFYQAPLAYTHFIKKRSAQFPLVYASPAAYYPANYYAATTYKLPIVQRPSILPAPIESVPAVPAVHLIKKRSAPLFPTTYYAPTTYAATTPLLASTYTATAPVLAHAPVLTHTPVISQPLAYAHLIKKRSADLLSTYIAPAAYSHQSRVDLQTSHIPYSSFAYSAPIAYSAPLAVSHLYK